MPDDDPVNSIEVRLQALKELLTGREFSAIESAIEAVLDRLLLGRILTDPVFTSIVELPDVYLSQTSQIIDSFMTMNGLEALIGIQQRRNIRGMILRGQAYQSRNALIADSTFLGLLRSVLQRGHSELRCESCGYHFRYEDIEGRRSELVSSVEISLSSSLHASRVLDRVKRPIMTRLEVDHIVPRIGWGGTDVTNLQILCQLCNQGKAIYVVGLEAVSVIAAGSYGMNHSIEMYPNRTIFYGSMSHAGSRCSVCERTSSSVELTAIPESPWFTPWSVNVVCYECSAL